MRIDELIVTLMLEAKGFKAGSQEAIDYLKQLGKTAQTTQDGIKKHADTTSQGIHKTGQESEKTRKSMEVDNRKLLEGFGKLKKEIIGTAAAFLGFDALKHFTADITNSDAALGRLSTQLGILPQRMAAIEGLFKFFGGVPADADAFIAKLKQIHYGLANPLTYGETFKAIFAGPASLSALGLGPTDFKPEDTGDIFNKVLAGFSKSNLPDDQKRLIAQSTGLFTSTSAGTVLTQAPGVADAQLQAQIRLINKTQDATKAAEDLKAAWGNVGTAIDNVGTQIGSVVDPEATKLLNKVTDWISNETQKAPEVIKDVKKKGILNTTEDLTGKVAKGIWDFAGWGKLMQGDVPDLWKSTWPHLFSPANTPGDSTDPISRNSALGLRNNNPGNLKYAGQKGAMPDPNSPFAKFATVANGLIDMARQLQRYASRQNDTIAGIVNKYAPASDKNNVPEYIKYLTDQLKVGPNAHLGVGGSLPPDVLKNLMVAMTQMETGYGYAHVRNIQSAVNSVIDVHVAQVIVNAPNAKTGGDIGKAIAGGLRTHLLVGQANTGTQ